MKRLAKNEADKYIEDRDLLKQIISHLADGGKDYGKGFIPLHENMRGHYIKVLKDHFGFSHESIKFLN